MNTEVCNRERGVSPGELTAFLPHACRELQLEVAVQVTTRVQEEYVSRAPRATRSRPLRTLNTSRARLSTPGVEAPSIPELEPEPGSEEDAPGRDRDRGFDVVPVTATLGPGGHVLELAMTGVRVPRDLMQVVALAAPYNSSFARFTLRRCRLRGDVVHELAKPAFAALTDVCLDDSPVPEANYATLLDDDRLQRLSLARVALADEACAELAARLLPPRPAARSLRVLELGSNAVGDAGAAALARALRTNRTLLHIDLAGNRIGDDGATELLRALTLFPLTASEVYAARRRRVACLRAAMRSRTASASASVHLREPAAAPRGVEDTKRGKKSGAGALEVEERPGSAVAPAFDDPFAPSETVCVEGHPYCIGNRVLCYLNLAYNSVSMLGARRVARALHAQETTRRALLRVVLEGNPLGGGGGGGGAVADVQELLERAVEAAHAAHLASTSTPRSDLARRRSLRFHFRSGN